MTEEKLNSVKSIVRENLKYYRKLHGWNQEQFSEASGVSRQTIANLECGCRDLFPTLSTAIRLCDALGITLDQLITEHEDESWRIW